MPSETEYFIDEYIFAIFLGINNEEELHQVWKTYQNAVIQITSSIYKTLLPSKNINPSILDTIDTTSDVSLLDQNLLNAMADPEIIKTLNANITNYNKKIYETYFSKLTKEQQDALIDYSKQKKAHDSENLAVEKSATEIMMKILKDNNANSYEELVSKFESQQGKI